MKARMAVSEIHTQSPESFQPNKQSSNKQKKRSMCQTFKSIRFLIVAPRRFIRHRFVLHSIISQRTKTMTLKTSPMLADLETPMLRVRGSVITHPCKHIESCHHSNIANAQLMTAMFEHPSDQIMLLHFAQWPECPKMAI